MDQATAGLPLFQYEGRLAQAELAFARHDADALRVATEALSLAESGGHLMSAAQLKELIRIKGRQ